MERSPIDARGIDAGFGKFIAARIVALIDENLVIDQTGQDLERGAGNVLCGNFGVRPRRRLGVAGADDEKAGIAMRLSPNSSMPKAWMIRRHGEGSLDALIVDIEGRPGIERQVAPQMGRHHPVVLPPGLKTQVFVGVHRGTAHP